MKLFRELFNWLKCKQKPFEPKRIEQTIQVPQPIRKNTPVTRLSKGGMRYRVIKHAANKKANSPAYTQFIKMA